jgi:hypothetical protein
VGIFIKQIHTNPLQLILVNLHHHKFLFAFIHLMIHTNNAIVIFVIFLRIRMIQIIFKSINLVMTNDFSYVGSIGNTFHEHENIFELFTLLSANSSDNP